MFCGIRNIAAAAAGRMSAHEAGLTDTCLISAAAFAFPIMFFVPLTVIGEDSQISELFSDPVLEGRAAQASAAAAIAVHQLSRRRNHLLAAVAKASPLYPTIGIPLLCNRKNLQFSESSAGQVFIAGLLLFASAGSHPSVFKKTRRSVHGITAVTPANPDGIAVLPLLCRFDSSQLPEPHACEIALSAHVYVFLPAVRFQGARYAVILYRVLCSYIRHCNNQEPGLTARPLV